MDLPARVRTVHADAWQVQGRLRERSGGAVAEVRGIRLMASGIAAAELNGGDVTAPDADVDAARAFFAGRGTAWGLRVPSGMTWAHGRRLRSLRLMGLEAGARHAHRPEPVAGLVLRRALAGDIDAVLAIDAIAFGAEPGPQGAWWAPMLGGGAAVTVALAEVHGEPVATGYAVHTDGHAGPAVHLGGIGVLPAARGRGIAAALSAWLLDDAYRRGAALAELHAVSDAAARLYARLGFFEAGALDVYVDV